MTDVAARERRLLPVALAYLPVPLAGAALSARWGVGASPGGSATDMAFRGTALTPPLFLPAALVGGAALARSHEPRRARLGAGVVAGVGALFLAGSTANLPNDLAAARAAGSPVRLTTLLAAGHFALALALLWHALPGVRGRRGDRGRPHGCAVPDDGWGRNAAAAAAQRVPHW